MTPFRTIWKFPLEIAAHQSVEMPFRAKPLSVQMQAGRLSLWAMCDKDEPRVQRTIYIVGTGQPADHVIEGWYVGTVQIGSFVWHVFAGFENT